MRDNFVVAMAYSGAYSGGRTAVFEELRRRLFAIAYRMLGMKADAEDIVQEAYVRWHQADADEVRSQRRGWLASSLASRLIGSEKSLLNEKIYRSVAT